MINIKQAMTQYPQTGIINLYENTKSVLTEEMLKFFNQYLLVYCERSDADITEEYAEKFEVGLESAKIYEHDYVVFNRARIEKRIENLIRIQSIDECVTQVVKEFGLDENNAEKYVLKVGLKMLDRIELGFHRFYNRRHEDSDSNSLRRQVLDARANRFRIMLFRPKKMPSQMKQQIIDELKSASRVSREELRRNAEKAKKAILESRKGE